jgi:hypothetical protein
MSWPCSIALGQKLGLRDPLLVERIKEQPGEMPLGFRPIMRVPHPLGVRRHVAHHLLFIFLEDRIEMRLELAPHFGSGRGGFRIDTVDAEPDLECSRYRHPTRPGRK